MHSISFLSVQWITYEQNKSVIVQDSLHRCILCISCFFVADFNYSVSCKFSVTILKVWYYIIMAVSVCDISPEISDVVRWSISSLHIGYVHNVSHIHYHNNPISLLKKYYPFEFPSMQIVPITDGEIRSIISSLKSKISSGSDGISTKILKLCGNQISKPLAFIFNKSITIGVFPEQLKYAVVILLHKKSDVSNTANYRPISLLPFFF